MSDVGAFIPSACERHVDEVFGLSAARPGRPTGSSARRLGTAAFVVRLRCRG
jgi:hypothetical protein